METKIAKAPTMPSVPNIARSLFHILLAARICAVLFSNVWDCDESYNYFEPAHFLLYGFGCQTWEYAPNYSLRSYAYLLVHIAGVYVPAVVFIASKIFIFYLIRFFLVMLEVWSQRTFVKAVGHHFGSAVGDMTLLLAAFSPGYFQASAAFLPSSSAMVIFQFALASLINKQYYQTAIAGAFSAFLVWPFSAALYVPAAFAVIFDLKWKSFAFAIKLAILVILGVVAPIVAIDTIFYGKFTAAAVNIFVYNFLSTDANRGSHLFGTAPTSFYFMNLFLNFNIAVPFSCLGLLVLAFVSKHFYSSDAEEGERKSVGLVIISTLLLWLGIFWPQPHKEERFLYPIYPLFCVTAAIGLQYLTNVVHRIFLSWDRLRTVLHDCIQFGFISVFVLLSLSRCASLYFNYHASQDVYLRFSESVKLPAGNATFNFCLGREWHRAPGHFLLVDNRVRLRFIESAFDGLVPAHYFENMTIANATRAPRYDMNDLNREEMSHYIPITSCHFLADINMEPWRSKRRWEKEPNYAADKSGMWTVLIRLPYLAHIDREEIEMPAWKTLAHRLLRAFYVPYFSPLFTSTYFRDYVVLQNMHLLPLKITNSVV